MEQDPKQPEDWKQFMKESRRQWRIQIISNVGLLALTAGVLILVLMRTGH